MAETAHSYHEMKIVLDGHFFITDETGQSVKATKGDVFYFPKGSKITFTTEDFGLAFYVGFISSLCIERNANGRGGYEHTQ